MYKAKSNQLSYPQNQYLKNSATSKVKYTNTQQCLPVNGYNLVHLTRHARLLAGGVYFAEKKQLIVGPYFRILALKFYVD